MAKNSHFFDRLDKEYQDLIQEGLYKSERVIDSPQGATVHTHQGNLINLCSNNYLGLSNHHELVSSAQHALEQYGFGLSSVRFICGTQNIHKQLEQKISEFLGFEDCILYSSCFDANGGLFETLFGPDDAIISDALNHASIIDGIRLCKAQRFRYSNNDMNELESRLQESQNAKSRVIATDGVFSMDGYIAKLKEICDLADRYDALVMVDDSHAVGFIGEHGKGTHEHCQVMGRIDIMTGTLGKALGGASGGYTVASKKVVDILRQRSRPYLFSNSLAPVITATSLHVIEMLQKRSDLRSKLKENTAYFRGKMSALGFELLPGIHPIIPIMLGDAKVAKELADQMLKEGVYVVAFSYPVVPKGQARIRTQMSAALSKNDLDTAIAAFAKVGKKMNLI